MFDITYDTWINTCRMYFELGNKKKSLYLQSFPFTKLSIEEQNYIMSKNYFDQYIKTGAFVLFPDAMFCSENYIQKSDGSFRDSSLVSPVLYLVIQAIGKEISIRYNSQRRYNIDYYYAGNYDEMNPDYKQEYDAFFKMININIEDCQYFIKTDLSNFFTNINLDLLVNRIDKICNNTTNTISQTWLYIIKELLLYCGRGKFPLIENSIASSYLATVIYLDEIDSRLDEYINSNITVFNKYKIVRYVDDMYILISSDNTEIAVHEAFNKIRNEYSSILKEYGLALNTQKCCFRPAGEINDELKKSIYDEFFHGEKHKIGCLFSGSLAMFLEKLLEYVCDNTLDIDKYNKLIGEQFDSEGIEFTPSEVFNYYVYEDDVEVKNTNVINYIMQLIRKDISFISFDPKRLSVLIIRTQSKEAIKALLNQLFIKDRKKLWNSYDTIIAISYLIQSEFKHKDLICVLRNNCKALDEYYFNFCARSFLYIFKQNKKLHSRCSIIGTDWKVYYLYLMYLVEQRKCSNMSKYAFYRSFFDRFTADMAFYIHDNPKDKHPNYNRYYEKRDQVQFYSIIPNAYLVINRAHKLRNANPLAHASSELIDRDSTSKDIDNSIIELEELIDQYIIEKNIMFRT